ncbi:MAG: phytanoyl-CoA dioxygenase family protein [Planctomycetia bacterium]
MKMPVAKLNRITQSAAHEGRDLDRTVLDDYGVFVLRGCVDADVVAKYLQAYTVYKASDSFDRNTKHLTEVRLAEGHPMTDIIHEPALRRLASELFPGGAGIYNIRLLKKDAEDASPVFLHQDFGYEYGSLDRYSLFVPLTECSIENGALAFVPGSHKFGYLGDAGAIQESLVPHDLETITPTASPGDIIVMNTCTWHRSGANEARTERVYYDIRLNPAEDPASRFTLEDGLEREYELNYRSENLFVNSRLQRLERYSAKYGPL